MQSRSHIQIRVLNNIVCEAGTSVLKCWSLYLHTETSLMYNDQFMLCFWQTLFEHLEFKEDYTWHHSQSPREPQTS